MNPGEESNSGLKIFGLITYLYLYPQTNPIR